MITSYKIENNNLYIFFDFSYEFGKFGFVKEEDIFSKILNYIRNKKIKFNGKTIILCASGIVFATLLFNGNNLEVSYNEPNVVVKNIINSNIDLQTLKKENNIKDFSNNIVEESIIKENKEIINDVSNIEHPVKVENKKENFDTVNNTIEENNNLVKKEDFETSEVEEIEPKEELILKNPITIYRANGQVITLELEEYLVGVLAAEMPASFNIEALKAGAVAARTYALKSINKNRKLTDTESTQSYNDILQLKQKWGSEFDKYYNKILDAVKSTEGVYMTYNGQYIDAVYHASNNGYTLSAVDVWKNDVPYLKSVESKWDIGTTSYLKTKVFKLFDFNDKLGIELSESSIININRDKTNHVLEIQIDENIFTGIQFRNKLGLRSTDFEIVLDNDNVIITTRGYGHGVGLSQYGANAMANNGYNYIDILNHYYTGITIAK